MSQYSVPHEKLEEECDDNLIIEISQHIKDHKEIGNYLNLSSDELACISQSNEDDVDGKINILWTWKTNTSSVATVLALLEAFLKMRDQSVAKSILKYLSQKTEPLQIPSTCILAPDKAKSHYPNWETLTESEKKVVRNQLMDENRDVRKAYTKFVSSFIFSYKSREIDPTDIQSLAYSFGQVEGSQKLPVVFNFDNNSNVSAAFCELCKHSTWFNYEIHQVIIENLGNDQEKEYLKTYEDGHLFPYLNRSIFEIPCVQSQDQTESTILTFKVSTDLCLTGNKVKVIQQSLAKFLGFQNSALFQFQDYKESCIELAFSLPTTVFKEISHKSQLFEWEDSQNCYKVNTDLITVL